MKVVKKIEATPYKMDKEVGSLLGKRTFSTFEKLTETLVSQRHKIFLPKDIDLVEYDAHLFQKQLDLEIMKIKAKPDNQQRTVTRQKNEQGTFTRLMNELEQIGKQYGAEMDEVY